jgi:predicted neutral ceramidase superfamily lipid hydrolase
MKLLKFIIKRTIENVWDEWATEHKKRKHHMVFWCSSMISLIPWLFFVRHLLHTVQEQYFVLVVLLSFIGPLVFGSLCWLIYFAINVVWCLLFPKAGFNWVLTEEEKKGKLIYLFDKKGRW